jgi:hypothetical protein
MPDRTLLALLDEIRGTTLRILSGVDETAATWRVPGLANHIVWHAGHIYVVVEWLSQGALGLEPVAPAGWFELFSWESRPAEVPPERFPQLSVVVEHLKSQHERLTELYGRLGELDLKNSAVDQPDMSVRQVIMHALQDEASHKGEIWLLRKMFAVKARV